MSVVSVRARDFILALFIRDDGQRFLLGDNGYDFKDSQLHFSANTIENDEVVKQGADGVMLAGQVRRASVQSFDGFVGDATMPKETIEQMRRDFFAFFAKGHHFRVVYVDTARNAWQRKGGYLVDAPEVKELYQIHPEYHVGLNFEDVSYYSYNENSDGDEILANTLAVPVSTDVNGGLEWDEDGAVSEPAVIEYDTETAEASGKSISISDAAEAPLVSFQLDGETSQNGTPTPDAPVPVKTVTGENVVKICGKNLWGGFASDYSATSATVAFVNKADGAITANGTSTGTALSMNSTQAANNGRLITLAAGTYTVSGAIPPVRLEIVSSSGSPLADTSSDTYASFTLTSTTQVFIRAKMGSSASASNVTVYPMLEKGSTATDYEPYQGQSYEINLGKNLLDQTTLNTGYVAYDGTITTTGIAQGEKYSPFIKVEPSTTYTFEIFSTTSSYDNWIGYAEYTSASESGFISPRKTASAAYYTFTTGNTTQYIRISARNLAAATEVQLSKGSRTTYAAYFEPIELCKIGDYQDYIYKNGGEWYLRKAINKYTTTGSEAWQQYQSGIYYAGTISGLTLPVDASVLCYSSSLKGCLSSYNISDFVSEASSVNYAVNVHRNTQLLRIKNADMTSLDGFKTWLAANPATIYYPLATPTDTEITNQALITQLDALLNNARTYAGVNNIFTVTPNEQGTLEIGYYTKYQPVVVSGGYVWEVGGEGGPTTVLNNSIDNVAPIWTVKGPTLNPTLENATTGEQIEYVGMIAEGQTLVIDMGEQTALLDGLNVISNVVGDYISLAPGANTLLYSVTGTADASEIGWSEIVG